jgi:hypothetical protein
LLVTDPSEVAVGAVLMQPIDGKEAIVGVASRTFTAVEDACQPASARLMAS